MVELLVVISIVMLLAAILVPVFQNFSRSQEQNSCMDNLRKLGVAVAIFHDDFGAYPAAPLPPFVATVGEAAAAAPLTAQPAAIQAQWQAQEYTPVPLRLADSAAAGASTVEVLAPPTVSLISAWRPATDADGNTVQVTVKVAAWEITSLVSTAVEDNEIVTIALSTHPAVPGWTRYTVTLATPLAGEYAARSGQVMSVLDPRVNNNGLEALYELYLGDRGSYTQSRTLFHCPTLKANASIKGAPPFWEGYNTYDQSYNYDQYDLAIWAFDTAMGYDDRLRAGTIAESQDAYLARFTSGLNRSRQLQNPTPPADTVVCWCFGHRPVPSPAYLVPESPDGVALPAPDRTFDLSQAAAQIEMRELGRRRRSERDLVLWVDGTVDVSQPYLLRGQDEGNEATFTWVPPFLSAPGAARQ